MRRRFFSIVTSGLAGPLMALVLCAAPAHAQWLRAESERFIVYTEGREADARAYVQTLESFDRLLRISVGLDVNEAPFRKLPIYLVGSQRDVRVIAPSLGGNVAGFYVAGEEDIFAVGLNSDDNAILLHEYAHHFMMQNFASAYPAWFVEGFAEYYMTTRFRRGTVEVGHYHENRAYWLQAGNWLPLETLLNSRPGEVRRNAATYYPLAWLLTHWFMGDERRRPMLHAYMLDIGAGADPVEAMERATGMSLTELRRALTAYMRGGLPYGRMTYDFPTVQPTITRLPRSASDLLLLNQRLKIGVREEGREDTAEEARRRAARHGGDPFARLVLGHAELHFGDTARGEAILTELLADEPDNIEALQLMASARMAQAETGEPNEYRGLMNTARGFLARAYRLDDADYRTLYLLARSRIGAPDYPNDNDMLTWRSAYVVAPQMGAARLGYAQALLMRGETEAAVSILLPLANNPHGGEGAAQAQSLIDEAGGAPAQPPDEAEDALDGDAR